MIDFNRKPSPKSDEEKRFDELNEQYMQKFGKPYVFSIGIDCDFWEEALEDMERRIRENDPKSEPEYDPEMIY